VKVELSEGKTLRVSEPERASFVGGASDDRDNRSLDKIRIHCQRGTLT
jgi:hypothetical protein